MTMNDPGEFIWYSRFSIPGDNSTGEEYITYEYGTSCRPMPEMAMPSAAAMLSTLPVVAAHALEFWYPMDAPVPPNA